MMFKRILLLIVVLLVMAGFVVAPEMVVITPLYDANDLIFKFEGPDEISGTEYIEVYMKPAQQNAVNLKLVQFQLSPVVKYLENSWVDGTGLGFTATSTSNGFHIELNSYTAVVLSDYKYLGKFQIQKNTGGSFSLEVTLLWARYLDANSVLQIYDHKTVPFQSCFPLKSSCATNQDCGFIDNGCGSVIKCDPNTPCQDLCIDNGCTDIDLALCEEVSGLELTKNKPLIQAMSSILTTNLIKLSKLQAIATALITWWGP